jgi:cytochrome c biogenesis protein CcdA
MSEQPTHYPRPHPRPYVSSRKKYKFINSALWVFFTSIYGIYVHLAITPYNQQLLRYFCALLVLAVGHYLTFHLVVRPMTNVIDLARKRRAAAYYNTPWTLG